MIKWILPIWAGILMSFAVCYVFIWALWHWLWLSIPLWIVAYLLHRKYGVIGK